MIKLPQFFLYALSNMENGIRGIVMETIVRIDKNQFWRCLENTIIIEI